jgi:pyridoxine kinase
LRRWLSGVKIVDMDTLAQAIKALHNTYHVPHVLITSVSLPAPGSAPYLSVVGSTMTSTGAPRIFEVKIPKIDCYFSGTGDMFAAMMVIRLREEVSKTDGLSSTAAWRSPDDVEATELPLATAAARASASMQCVLMRTKEARDEELKRFKDRVSKGPWDVDEDDKQFHRIVTKSSEVRLVRNLECLRNPELEFSAEKVQFNGD